MAKRITQSPGGGDNGRMFTVRPRTAAALKTEKRGTVSTIRYVLPGGSYDTAPYAADRNSRVKALSSAGKTPLEEAVGVKEPGGAINGFINFVAQSVSYNIQEKSQVMHTFGGSQAVYFYGQAPIIVSLTGLLVDDLDNNQMTKFITLYQDYLRGSMSSKDYCYTELKLNNAIFTGAFTNISIQQSADRDTDIQFSAQFITKTFVLSSTDDLFENKDGGFVDPGITRYLEPSITAEALEAVLAANAAEVTLTAERDEENTADDSAEASWVAGASDFGSLPDLSFIGDLADAIDNATGGIPSPPSFLDNLIASLNGYAKDAMSLIDSIEGALDFVLNSVDSTTKSVYGTAKNLGNAFDKITNFPDALSGKMGSIGLPGGKAPKVAGGGDISADVAASLLLGGSNVGSARGTPAGDAAVLKVASSAGASLSLGGGDDGDPDSPGGPGPGEPGGSGGSKSPGSPGEPDEGPAVPSNPDEPIRIGG